MPTMIGPWRWARAVAVAVAFGALAAWWAASQFDTPLTGQPTRFGFHAWVWGGVAAIVGFALGARGMTGRIIGTMTAVLTATLLVVWLWVNGLPA